MIKNGIIDLFSGVGGFSLGFEKAGFKSICAIDLWEDAINTFNANHKNRNGILKSVYDFTDQEILALNKDNNMVGIIGGPPCQGFSMVGTRNIKDERNTLYLQYVRFVELLKPEFFILENVKGLLTLKSGFFKKDILKRFSELGYNVTYKVLKASDYGVPQSRERVFFVGLRKDIFNDKFFEYPEPNGKYVCTKDALSDLPSVDNNDDLTKYISKPMNEFQKLMRSNSKNTLYNHEKTNHSQQTIDIISKVPDGGKISDISDELYTVRNFKSAFKRMDSTKPSSTIDCGHRNYFHYKENRIPTVRESARLQSFPDDYIFTSSKTSQYTQVGNAVPVLLSYEIAKKMKMMLESEQR